MLVIQESLAGKMSELDHRSAGTSFMTGEKLRDLLPEAKTTWNEWKEQKEGCLTSAASAAASRHAPNSPPLAWRGRLNEKRNRLRFVLKQRFEDWAVRPMARLLGGNCALQS